MDLDKLKCQYGVQIQEVTYQMEDIPFQSALCKPSQQGNYPAIIVIHGIFGLQEMDVRFAARLSAEGYVVLVHGWQSNEKDPADRDIVRGIESAIEFLKQNETVDKERMGLVGVCRGGSIAMITGAYLPMFNALVSFYGQSYYPYLSEKKPHSPIDLANKIQSKMMIIHGEEDSIFSVQESYDYCRVLAEQNKPHQCKFYPQAEHGFFLEGHRNYHQEASEHAWNMLKCFLKEELSDK